MKDAGDHPHDSDEETDRYGGPKGDEKQSPEDGATADQRALMSTATQGH